MSLYHSGVRPESQSKATRVMTSAKMAMKAGANLRARRLKAGSLVASCFSEPPTSIQSARRQSAKAMRVRTEKKGRLSQKALPARIGWCAASGRAPG
ncbi:MAG TPA: hypothetical protein DHV93_04450 [Holophagaceae bacterium]|nr:hypothetical protein [Holophagaceae bacterium]